MELKLSNQELVVILISIVAIALISGAALYHAPVGAMIEGFVGGLQGSSLNYTMGNGVVGSWENDAAEKGSCKTWYKSLESNKGSAVPLPSGDLSMFSDTKQSPNCCPSTYSGSDGCVCASVEQMKYLNSRGGNRTLCSEF